MRSSKRDSNLYVGIDESNHGRFPEYFVAAFSQIRSDISQGSFEKVRVDHNQLFRKLNCRDYSFLLLNESDLGKHPKRNAGKFKMIDNIVASLIYGINLTEYDEFKILIDGELTKDKLSYVKDAVSDLCSLERSRISIISGPQFDKKYLLVNIADEIAHYLFRHIPSAELKENKRRKDLFTRTI